MKQGVSSTPNQTLLIIIRISLYALTVMPLLFSNKFLFFHNTTKTYFLFALAQIMFVCFLWLIVRAGEWRPKFSLIDKTFFLYIGIITLTTLVGIDPVYSFWGSLDRMTGLLLWLHLLGVFFVTISILRTQKEWYSLFRCSIWVAIVVSSIRFLSLGGTEIVPLENNGSTFGNSSFLGIYLIFHFFLALLITLDDKKQTSRLLGICASLFFFLTLLSMDANAAQLAITGGGMLLVALLCIFHGKQPWKKYAGWTLLIVLFTTFILTFALAFKPESMVRQKLIDVSSGSRFVLWDIAWQAIQERPMRGWGLENFGFPALKHYQTCLSTPACGREMWFDRAHNKILDVWIESGLLGLLAYGAIFMTVIFSMWRLQKKEKKANTIAAVVIACSAAYFVQNLTALDTVSSLLFWILLLACASSATKPYFFESRQPPAQQGMSVQVVMAFTATVLLPFSFFFFIIQPIQGNIAYGKVRNATTIEERLQAYKTGTTVSPLGLDMRRVFLADHTASVFWAIPKETLQKTESVAHTELDLAINGLLQNHTKTNELRTAIALGIMYQTKGHFFDPAAFQKAEEILKKAIKDYPNHPQPKWTLAGVYLDQGKVQEALTLTKSVVDEAPSEIAYNYYLIAVKWTGRSSDFQEQTTNAFKTFPNLKDDIEKLKVADIQKDGQTLLSQFHH